MRLAFAVLVLGLSAVAPASAADELLVPHPPNGDAGMHVVDLAGNEVAATIADTAFGEWSPDGSRIITSIGGDVTTMAPDGTKRETAGRATLPVFSPDGTRYAGVVSTPSDLDIRIGSVDSTDPPQLVPNLPPHLYISAARARIAWSSRDEIAFVYAPAATPEDGSTAVGVIRPDGSGFRQVLHLPLPPKQVPDDNTHDEVWDIAFSPDGRTLAVGRYRGLGRATMQSPYRFDFRITTVALHDGGLSTDRSVGTGTSSGGPVMISGTYPTGLSFAPDGQRLVVAGTNNGDHSALGIYRPADGSMTSIAARGYLKPRWRPARTPIVFVHGFAGSKLFCGNRELWLPVSGAIEFPAPQLNDMRLADDGVTDAGGCTVTTREQQLVERAGSSDVYGSTADFLRRIAPTDLTLYAWDWRKSPAQALAGLDQAIESARCGASLPAGTTCAQPTAEKVVVMAHSMGGLVTRWYIDDPARAAKVSRVLILGTPFWGSPKAFFPLAAGVERPDFTLLDLDLALDDQQFKAFARNLTGEYFLWPSANYGPWLSIAGQTPGETLDRPALLAHVGTELGGNAALLAQALDAHASTLDGFERHGTDLRVVAGRGIPTIDQVRWIDGATDLLDRVEIRFTNGDGTVPLRSAIQGPENTGDPLGDDVPLSYSCGVSHVPLGGDQQVTSAIEGFLLSGTDIPQIGGSPCPALGAMADVFDIGLTGSTSSIRVRAAQGGAMSVEQADRQGLLDVIGVGAQRILVADADRPVTVTLALSRGGIRARAIDGDKLGPPAYYGPLKGAVELRLGATVEVRQNGRSLKPARADETAPATVPRLIRRRGRLTMPVPKGNPMFVAVGPASLTRMTRPLRVRDRDVPRVRSTSVDAFGNSRAARALLAVSRLRVRGRSARATVACPTSFKPRCRGSVAITSRGRRIGSRRLKLRAGRRAVVKVRLTRRARGRLGAAVRTGRGRAARLESVFSAR